MPKSRKTLPPGPEEGMLTTEQVVEGSGVSRVTLFAWVKRALLPKPHVYTDPDGRGRRAYWYPHVVQSAKRLRALGGRGLTLEAVVKRDNKVSYMGSSMSSGLALHMAQSWRVQGTAGDLAGTFELPAGASRADVFAVATKRIAVGVGLNDGAAEGIKRSAYNGLTTALYNFIHGIETVVVWNGVLGFVVPKVAIDTLHIGNFSALEQLSPKPAFTFGDFTAVFRAANIGLSDDYGNAAALVSVETTALMRDLWQHYGESMKYGADRMPRFTLQRGYSIRDSDAGSAVEYDYLLAPSGFDDKGITISIDTASARIGGQGGQEVYWREFNRKRQLEEERRAKLERMIVSSGNKAEFEAAVESLNEFYAEHPELAPVRTKKTTSRRSARPREQGAARPKSRAKNGRRR
jgi:MerR-like DNA binding protein